MKKYRIIKIIELHNKEKNNMREKIRYFPLIARVVLKFCRLKVLEKEPCYFFVTDVD